MEQPENHVLTFRCYAYPGNNAGADGYFAECIDANLMVWRPDLVSAVEQVNEALQGFLEASASVSGSHDEFHELIDRPSPFWPSKARYHVIALTLALPRVRRRNRPARTIVQDIATREPQLVPA